MDFERKTATICVFLCWNKIISNKRFQLCWDPMKWWFKCARPGPYDGCIESSFSLRQAAKGGCIVAWSWWKSVSFLSTCFGRFSIICHQLNVNGRGLNQPFFQATTVQCAWFRSSPTKQLVWRQSRFCYLPRSVFFLITHRTVTCKPEVLIK